MQRLVVFYFCFSTFIFNAILGQNNSLVLEKKMTLQALDLSIVEVLKSITKQSGLLFSYNPSVFNDTKKVKLSFKQVPLRLVLEAILKGTNHVYKLKKNYIIIYPVSAQKTETQSTFKFSGYVFDGKDSISLENVSIYIKQHKQSSLSNQFGYFVVQYPKSSSANAIAISIAKENYEDTVIVLNTESQQNVKIYLKSRTILPLQISRNQNSILDTIRTPLPIQFSAKDKNRFIQPWLGLKRLSQNLRNINDTLFSKFSLSLVPLLSTNKLLSINTINNASVNLLVGYSKGTRVAEFGGVLNIDNGNVQYVQASGVGNVVTGSVRGLQAAGVFNIVNQKVSGVQMGGVLNTANNLMGVQLGGVFNHIRYGNGFQSAGFYNYVQDSFNGVQSAGVFNMARQLDGIQIGGILNIAKEMKGVQLSGALNHADNVEGVQISGLINTAKRVSGLQLSFINIADTIDGLPIGIFSFVKKGHHQLELSTNELLFYTVGFRTGVKRFHNIFSIGSNSNGANSFLAYGYGFGSSFPLKGRWSCYADITAHGLYNYKLKAIGTNSITKCAIGFEYRWNRKLAIAIAPSFNLVNQDISKVAYLNALNAIIPHAFYDKNLNDGMNLKMWLGFNAAIRLF
jgi:hypothetical protein